MRKYNNVLMGYYLPSFFFINLNTDEELNNLEELSDSTKSTFYHEYVHFIQDLTTTFGLTNTIQQVNIQKAINEQIINSKEKEFITPVTYESYDSIENYSNLTNMFLGDYKSDFSSESLITSINLKQNELIPSHEEKEYVEIEFITRGKKSSLSLGGIAVMENMANLIEKSLYDNVNSPIYPYNIIEIMIDYIYPDYSKEPLDVIMLCDYALNSPDPGKFIFELVLILKEKGITSYQDAYEVLRKYEFMDISKKKLSVYSLFEKRSEEAKTQLQDYFTIPLYVDNNKWISEVLKSTQELRLGDFNFWVTILSNDSKEKRRNIFNELISKIGYPLLSNNKSQFAFNHPKIIPKYMVAFKAIFEVHEVMMKRQTKCNLIEFCKKGEDGKDITNELCNTPWERGLKDPLCPFGQIIKMWGVHTKTPI